MMTRKKVRDEQQREREKEQEKLDKRLFEVEHRNDVIRNNDILVNVFQNQIKFEVEDDSCLVVVKEESPEDLTTSGMDIDLAVDVIVKEEVDILDESDNQENEIESIESIEEKMHGIKYLSNEILVETDNKSLENLTNDMVESVSEVKVDVAFDSTCDKQLNYSDNFNCDATKNIVSGALESMVEHQVVGGCKLITVSLNEDLNEANISEHECAGICSNSNLIHAQSLSILRPLTPPQAQTEPTNEKEQMYIGHKYFMKSPDVSKNEKMFCEELKEIKDFIKWPFYKQYIIQRVLFRNQILKSKSVDEEYPQVDEFDKYLENIDQSFKAEYKVAEDILHINGTKININDKQKSLSCSVCDFATYDSGKPGCPTLSAEYLVWDHIVGEHFSVFNCPACSEHFKSRINLLRHVKQHRNKQKVEYCDVCAKPYSFTKQLRAHKWTHKSKQEKIDARNQQNQMTDFQTPHNCPYCQREYTNKYNLKYHIEKQHSPPNSEQNACLICEKLFLPLALKNHEKTCGVQKNEHRKRSNRHNCHMCNKAFAGTNNLRDHINFVHYDLRKYQCHICQKALQTKSLLNLHVAQHSNTTMECSEKCGSTFKTKRSWKKHETKCTGAYTIRELPWLTCEVCSQEFRGEGRLKTHVTRMHKRAPK